MLTDGIEFIGSSAAKNLQIETGSTLPTEDNYVGELFNLTTGNIGLHVYTASGWVPVLNNPQIRAALTAGTGTVFNPSTGVISAPNYDLVVTIAGKPAVSANVLNFVTPRAFTLPVNLTGSLGRAGTAATATTTFTIKKNGSSVGTLQFAAGQTASTFTFAAQQTFNAGDLLQITAPVSADANLADISIALIGTLV
jgi:hypothetical protein